jgi:4'-phosphopantetheinyl transferase EntD
VTKQLSHLVLPLLEPGVHFAEVWAPAGGDDDLEPLFPEEEALVLRAVAKRTREVRAGRQAARRALARSGGSYVALPRGSKGEPVFPRGYRGSITHTGRADIYAAAIASQGPWLLGIDAELQSELGPELAQRVASPSELELARVVSTEPGLLTFAAKEAAYKCVSPLCERILGFEEVRLVRAEGALLELEVLPLPGTFVRVRWLRDQGVTLCVAALPFSGD